MDNNSDIIFFVRAYNDLDHMAPVIYKLRTKYPSLSISVLNLSLSTRFHKDFRVKFLNKIGINFSHILSRLGFNSLFLRLYFKSMEIDSNLNKYNPFRFFINRFIIQITRKFIHNKLLHYDSEKLLLNINGELPRILIFDKTRTYFPGTLYKNLASYSKKNNIITVAMPHGHNTWSNTLIAENSMEINPDKPTVNEPFYTDYVIFENKLFLERYENFGLLEPEQIVVLGSSRFCDEWNNKIRNIVPQGNLPETSPDTFKVLCFVPEEFHNANLIEFRRTINYISQFPNVVIIIKLHTRHNYYKERFPDNVFLVGNDIHSPQLIDWSNLILFTSTSVIFDAIKRDRPILYMKNTQANKLLSEDYFSSWEIHCRDELRDNIWSLIEDRNYRTYSLKDAQDYCRNTIEPVGKDILNLYADFLFKLTEKST